MNVWDKSYTMRKTEPLSCTLDYELLAMAGMSSQGICGCTAWSQVMSASTDLGADPAWSEH